MAKPVYNVRLLRDQLVAMRQLPPGTQLPQLAAQDERQLLSELLRLPDEVDPLRWLQTERGPLIARVLLRKELQRLKGRVVGQRRVNQAGWTVPEEQQALLGGLEDLPEDAAQFARIEEHPEASPEVLRNVLQQLRALRNPSAPPTPPVASKDQLGQLQHLLSDLLSQPDRVDPLPWLQVERSALAAVVALSHVLQQSRPPPTLEVGTTLHIVKPRKVLRAPNHSFIKIEELVWGTEGFAITLHAWPRGQQEARPAGVDRIHWTWLGFNRIIEDRGYHYAVQHRELGVGSGLFGREWSRKHLRMAFYPAVAPDATALTFISRLMVLEVSGVRITDRSLSTLSLPEEQAGELAWRVNLPRFQA
jgi:hypothetical protein